MIVRSNCIILNSRKFGDTSKIVTVFSEDYGKISLIAKGARNSKSKFGSSLEPISCSNLTFYLKPNTELFLLSNSEIYHKWSNIYKSEELLTAGFMIVETISISQLSKNPNIELYNLLNETLEKLNEPCFQHPYSIVIWFFCRFSELMGFELSLNKNNFDNSELITIQVENGNIVQNSITNKFKIFRLNKELANKFRDISFADIDSLINNDLEKSDFLTLNHFFSIYFSYHLDCSFILKSSNLI